jgi:hypothetical protein
VQRLGQRVDGAVDLLAGDDQRRSDAQRTFVGLLAEDAAITQRHRDLAPGLGGRVDVDAGPQAAPAYGHQTLADQLIEPTVQVLAEIA